MSCLLFRLARTLSLTLLLTPLLLNAARAQTIDCPLREAPYSLETPAIDILLKPEAVSVVSAVHPGLLDSIPTTFMSTQPPTFAAILPLRTVLRMGRVSEGAQTEIDLRLRALPVTGADQRARCARYDTEPVRLRFEAGRPRVLLFEKIIGFRDGPSVEAAHAAFEAMAERNGWALTSTDRGGAITRANLARVDVILWNNVSGDVLTLTQRRALERFVRNGGGFVAVHGSGGDPTYFWDWYADTLIGARFIGHPMAPQFQDARIVIHEDAGVGRGLAPGWTMNDEWYSFASNPAQTGARIIASLDESTYSPVGREGQDLRMGAHPIAWTRCVGEGRSFYSAIGHRPETYADPNHVRLLEQAVSWAAGRGETQCRRGQELPRR